MTESSQLLLAIASISAVLIYAALTSFGGRSEDYLNIENRVWGRWIAPIFFNLCIFCLYIIKHISLWQIICYLIYFAFTHHLGYGGDTTLQKVFRRTLHSTLRSAALIPLCLVTGRWEVYIAQVICGLTVAVLFGVKNPVKAPQEEFIISFSNAFLTPFVIL